MNLSPAVTIIVFILLAIGILLAWEFVAWWLDISHSPLGFGARESALRT